MTFKITYYGGIPHWNTQQGAKIELLQDAIVFTKGNIFTASSYHLPYTKISQLRFKAQNEMNYRKPLNRYIIGNYIFKSKLLGLLGVSSGLQTQEVGYFRIFYSENNMQYILSFKCKRNASVLFNALQQKIRL